MLRYSITRGMTGGMLVCLLCLLACLFVTFSAGGLQDSCTSFHTASARSLARAAYFCSRRKNSLLTYHNRVNTTR